MDVQTATGVSFADVAGVDEAKDGLMEVVDFPQAPEGMQAPGRAHSQRRAARGSSRHRQDAAGFPFFPCAGAMRAVPAARKITRTRQPFGQTPSHLGAVS